MESAEVERDLADLDVSHIQLEPLAAMNPLPWFGAHSLFEILAVVCVFVDVDSLLIADFDLWVLLQRRLAAALEEENYDEAAELDAQMTEVSKY